MSHLQRAGSLARIRHILDYFCEQVAVAMKKPLFTPFSICIVGLTACTTSPHPAAETALPLSPQQQANLRQLLGLTGSSPFTVKVLDTDHNGTLNVGDTVTLNLYKLVYRQVCCQIPASSGLVSLSACTERQRLPLHRPTPCNSRRSWLS